MLYLRKPLTASAGSNTLYIRLPHGSILKRINLQNITKGWELSSASIAKREDATEELITLINSVTQVGIRDVSWEGEMEITEPYSYIVAVFAGCDANDELYLTVGYDAAPTIPRRWW